MVLTKGDEEDLRLQAAIEYLVMVKGKVEVEEKGNGGGQMCAMLFNVESVKEDRNAVLSMYLRQALAPGREEGVVKIKGAAGWLVVIVAAAILESTKM